MKNGPIIFFGAGPVAAKSLELLNKHLEIEAVITKGPLTSKRDDYPVIKIAEALKIKLLYANNKKEVDDVCKNTFISKIGVLIDFGVIISEEAIKSFPKGIVNSHFSLLPEWRGADPITYSLLSGQEFSGVTLMILVSGMDEGPILSQDRLKIEKDDTGATLTEKLIILSDNMLERDMPKYLDNEIVAIDQIEFAYKNNRPIKPSYSSKINKKDGKIDWNKTAEEIEREIRAFQPWPRSFTTIGENLLISISKAAINDEQTLTPGRVKAVNNRLFVGTKDKAIELLEVQPAGKNKMPVTDFLRGYLNKLFVQID